MSQSRTVASPQLLTDAQRLLRSLAGVVDARVHTSGSRIDAIHVEVTDPDRASVIAGHVRSALLAGLATPVTPARIHVRVVGNGHTDVDTDDEPNPTPRHRLRLVQEADARTSHPLGTETARAAETEGAAASAGAGATNGEAGPTDADAPPVTARPRLVAVDRERHGDGRVLCSVTVAYGTDVHRADAVAVDLPGAAAQAAAQATVRALAAAGLDTLELDGLREVEIAGRQYVLVALRRADHYTRVRSGSAPITGAPERAAAMATVDAAGNLT
ncbi:MAG: hypothetical protein R6U63_06350 [Longimicrobiales bacterium]